MREFWIDEMQTAVIKKSRLSVGVVMTGGTIAKTYDARGAVLRNSEPIVQRIIAGLRVDKMEFEFVDLLHMDSLDIGIVERAAIVATVRELSGRKDAVLISHGTDTLVQTAEQLAADIPTPSIPIALTGAMMPHAVHGSDSKQNVTEALLAIRLLCAGIFIVFHNHVLSVPGVIKDYEKLTFVQREDGECI
jgi:L-asparaginase